MRYYVCPVIGTGTVDDPYRLKVCLYATNVVSVIPSDLSTGKPLYWWGLCRVDAKDHTFAAGDPDIVTLPAALPNVRLNDLPEATRNGIVAILRKVGLDASILGSEATCKDVIHAFGKALDATFDVSSFLIGN